VCTRVRNEQRQAADCRWRTIHYALGSNARTLRLCLIMVVASLPPSAIALLIHR